MMHFEVCACLQGFLAEGLQRTSAGLGSVIIDSQPLTVALLASVLFGERLGALGFVGLGLGVVGLCFLEVPVEALQGELLLPIFRSPAAKCGFLALPLHTLLLPHGKGMSLSAAFHTSLGGCVCQTCMQCTWYAFDIIPTCYCVKRSGQCRVCMRSLQVHQLGRWGASQASHRAAQSGTAGNGGCCSQRRAWQWVQSWCLGSADSQTLSWPQGITCCLGGCLFWHCQYTKRAMSCWSAYPS